MTIVQIAMNNTLTYYEALSAYFTSITKAKLGLMMSMTRQIFFLLPLIIIFPKFLGIDGVLYAGPIADGAAFIIASLFSAKELRLMK